MVQWLRDEVKLINDSCDSEYFASKVSDNGGVYVVPAFTGLGAPYWDMSAQGSILGLTRGTGRDHIIRAALESIVYQTEDVLAAMQEDMKTNAGVDALGAEGITSLKVDGGASDNRLLMQFQSDISGIPVTRPSTAEATAWGAAALAALAVGFFETPADTLVTREGGFIYTPDMDDVKRKALLDGWHRAVKACREF